MFLILFLSVFLKIVVCQPPYNQTLIDPVTGEWLESGLRLPDDWIPPALGTCSNSVRARQGYDGNLCGFMTGIHILLK